MPASPDATPYVDLRLFDKDSQDVFNAAIVALKAYLPEWNAREGHTEVMLLEALALEVSEAIFAINRLPGATLEALLRLYNITRDIGLAPTTTLTFTVSDTAGHDLPAGTRAALIIAGADPVVFTTTTALAIAVGQTTGTVAAIGDRTTAEVNGTVTGTGLDLLDAVVFVERVVLGSSVVGGAGLEDDAAYFGRGVLRFSRLVETLVLPRHFTAAALERTTLVSRAVTLDNYSAELANELQTVALTGAPTGGTFTLSYGGQTTSALAYNATAPQVEAALNALTGLGAGAVSVTGGALPGAPVAVQFIGVAVRASDVTAITGSGAALTPAGGGVAVTETRKGGGAVGTHAGYVTVAVYGLGGFVPAATRETLRAEFDLQAQANLSVSVIDPTITDVTISVTVVVKAGFAAATVQASVIAALNVYLAPATWPFAGTVYRNELIALIDGVAGVDRVQTLTSPAADLVLAGVAPLARLAANPTVTVA